MEDTIYSLATAPGKGAISIIRISGNDALATLKKIFKGRIQDHMLCYGTISYKGNDIDNCLAVYMMAPKTYTKQDVVELHIHGGFAGQSEILEILSGFGLRQAEPGEFTKRAFLNGRIDLSQAEAVMGLIDANTQAQRKIAMSQMAGNSGKFINSIRESVLDILAKIGVAIDYPDEDIEEDTMESTKQELAKIIATLKDGISSHLYSQILNTGYKIAIIGRPNVGKSSLVNGILGKDRVIVTDIAGTTRDTLKESFSYKGYLFTLLDTAGIRESTDVIEKMGIEKSHLAMEEANVVLAVFDGSKALTFEDEKVLELTKSKNPIIVINKSDLPKIIKLDGTHICAKSTAGIDNLLEIVYERMCSDMGIPGILTNSRHISLANNAVRAFEDAIHAIESLDEIECIEIHIRDGWHALCEITGEAVDEEIINHIFEKFCLGK